MNNFKENNCRVCKKVFCCKKCRERHETSSHGIFPDCDICLYGRAILTNITENLMKHIKNAHWPLRCVFCKRFFGTTDELTKHNKCPVGHRTSDDLENSPYTPGHSYTEGTYDSPPLLSLFPKNQQSNKDMNMLCNLATSTPMQRGDENNILEQIQEVITPVEYSQPNKESIIKTKQNDSDNVSLKRKVTFCETPMTESCKNVKKQKNVTKKRDQDEDKFASIPTPTVNSSSTFYSAKEPQKEFEENQSCDIFQNIPIIKVATFDNEKGEDKENDVKNKEESTLWISAVNISTSDINEELIPDHVEQNTLATTTPVVAKLKKRQVNIVAPTSVTRKEEINVELNIRELLPSNPESGPSEPNVNQFGTTDELDKNSNSDVKQTTADISLNASRFWPSISKLIKNVTSVIQGVNRVDENVNPISNASFKRCSPDTDYDSADGPRVKRYKLTEIKCRRTIRELPAVGTFSWQINDDLRNNYHIRKPILVDKATQTDDFYLPLTADSNIN